MPDLKWREYLAPFFGKRCAVQAKSWMYDKHLTVYIFDEEKEKKAAKTLFDEVIDSWELVEEELGKGRKELVLFALKPSEDDDAPMGYGKNLASFLRTIEEDSQVDIILFYDREDGSCYAFDGGSFFRLGKTQDSSCRLDQLKLKVL